MTLDTSLPLPLHAQFHDHVVRCARWTPADCNIAAWEIFACLCNGGTLVVRGSKWEPTIREVSSRLILSRPPNLVLLFHDRILSCPIPAFPCIAPYITLHLAQPTDS